MKSMSSFNHQMCQIIIYQIMSRLSRGTNSTVIDPRDKCKRCLGHVKRESCLVTTTESPKCQLCFLPCSEVKIIKAFDICPLHFVLCGNLLKQNGLPYKVNLESNGYFSSMPVQPGLFAPSVTCTLPLL